jgi:hypothetical protein
MPRNVADLVLGAVVCVTAFNIRSDRRTAILLLLWGGNCFVFFFIENQILWNFMVPSKIVNNKTVPPSYASPPHLFVISLGLHTLAHIPHA